MLSLRRSRSKQIDDLLDGFVGAVICGFQYTVRLVTLTPQSVELLALRCRQAAVTTSSIAIGLRNPVPDRTMRKTRSIRVLSGRAPVRRGTGADRDRHSLATDSC